jgi:hypothetical protein
VRQAAHHRNQHVRADEAFPPVALEVLAAERLHALGSAVRQVRERVPGEHGLVEHVGSVVFWLVLALLDLLKDHFPLTLQSLGVEARAQQDLFQDLKGEIRVRQANRGGDLDDLATSRDGEVATSTGNGSDQGIAGRPAVCTEQQRALQEAGRAGGLGGLVARAGPDRDVDGEYLAARPLARDDRHAVRQHGAGDWGGGAGAAR